MKVTIDMTRGSEGSRMEVETPALIFVTDNKTYYVDSDAFTEESVEEMSMRDRALLKSFVTLAIEKLGWNVTYEKEGEQ